MIILQEIQKHAMEQPEKLALIENDTEITYSMLWQRILSASEHFRKMGSRGDRVILAANKSVEFVYAYFGAQLAGWITVTIDSAVNALRLKRIRLPRLLYMAVWTISRTDTIFFHFRKLISALNQANLIFLFRMKTVWRIYCLRQGQRDFLRE